LGGIRGAVNDTFAGVMGMLNQPKIDALQQQIDALEAQREQVRADIMQRIQPLQKRIDALNKHKQEYKEDYIDPLNSTWRRFATKCWDFGRTCKFFIGAWWCTVIGAIIDILFTFPLLFIFYMIGVIKGKHIRDLNAKVKKHQQAIDAMSEEQGRFRQAILIYQNQLGQFEQEIQARTDALEREQSQLTQVFKGPNRASPPPLGLAT
jgi:predicted phage tail protein